MATDDMNATNVTNDAPVLGQWREMTPEEVAEMGRQERKRRGQMRRKSQREMKEAGVTTLSELLDPKWVRDFDWDLEMLGVLRMARRGWEWSMHVDFLEANTGTVIYDTTNGAVFVDELVRIAWEYDGVDLHAGEQARGKAALHQAAEARAHVEEAEAALIAAGVSPEARRAFARAQARYTLRRLVALSYFANVDEDADYALDYGEEVDMLHTFGDGWLSVE